MFSGKNKDKIYIVIFIIIVVAGVIYKIILKGELPGGNKENIVIGTGNEVQESSESEDGTIYVYICGAVNSPGVYEIDRGSILYDAVELAGGLSPDAAREEIDLVMELNENISVKIPKVGEDVKLITDVTEGKVGNGLVNINSADKELLKTLPGIGDMTADAIIEYRGNNVFEEKEDLMNVKGIGQSKYNKVKDLICVN